MAAKRQTRPANLNLQMRSMPRAQDSLKREYYAPVSLVPSNNPTAYHSAVAPPIPDAEWVDRMGPEYTGTLGLYSPRANYIDLRSSQVEGEGGPSTTLSHELGHSMWYGLPQQQQEQWEHIHNQYLQRVRDPNYGGERVPYANIYRTDPGHSFAGAIGEYMADSRYFRENSPRTYNYLRSVVGTEYDRDGLPVDLSNPAATVPLPNTPEIPTLWQRNRGVERPPLPQRPPVSEMYDAPIGPRPAPSRLVKRSTGRAIEAIGPALKKRTRKKGGK